MEVKEDPVVTISPGWDFELFPNPSRSEVFVSLSGNLPKEIVLFDPSGRRIQTMDNITSAQVPLPVSHLAKGLYYVRVSVGLSMKMKKLIIH